MLLRDWLVVDGDTSGVVRNAAHQGVQQRRLASTCPKRNRIVAVKGKGVSSSDGTHQGSRATAGGMAGWDLGLDQGTIARSSKLKPRKVYFVMFESHLADISPKLHKTQKKGNYFLGGDWRVSLWGS